MSRAEEPAFAVPGWKDDPAFNGLTIREHFAGLAMQGLLASTVSATPEGFALKSVACADALIAELSKVPS